MEDTQSSLKSVPLNKVANLAKEPNACIDNTETCIHDETSANCILNNNEN